MLSETCSQHLRGLRLNLAVQTTSAALPHPLQGVNSQRGTLPWCGPGCQVCRLVHMCMRGKVQHPRHMLLHHRHIARLMESCHLRARRTAPEIIRTPDAVTEKIDVFR